MTAAELGRIVDDDSPEAERELATAIIDYGIETYGGGTGVVLEKQGALTHSILMGHPDRIQHDYGYRERDLLPALDDIGFDLTAQRLDGTPLVPVSSNSHPEAFWLRFSDHETSETTQISFRYPPGTQRWAPHNEKLLNPRGFQLLELNTYSGWMVYYLIETEQVRTLHEQYGPAVGIFGFEICHEAPLRDRALEQYDPDSYLDHEAEYGVPEPDKTHTVVPE